MTPETINGVFAVGGAAIGAVITGIFSWKISNKDKCRKEISLITTRPTKLIEVDAIVSEVVTISVSGEEVPTLYTLDCIILNSGTEAIENVKASLSLEGSCKVVAADVGASNFDCPTQDSKVEETGDGEFIMSLQYLNSSDQIIFKYLLSDKPKSLKVSFRQPGVNLVTKESYDSAPSLLTRGLFEAIRSNGVMHAYMRIMMPSYRSFLEHEKKEKEKTGPNKSLHPTVNRFRLHGDFTGITSLSLLPLFLAAVELYVR